MIANYRGVKLSPGTYCPFEFPGPPTNSSTGMRSSTYGSCGNGACGSAWYQYATDENVSER